MLDFEALLVDKRALEALHDHYPTDAMNSVGHEFAVEVLDGTTPLEISHGGGEFHDLTRDLLGDFWNL